MRYFIPSVMILVASLTSRGQGTINQVDQLSTNIIEGTADWSAQPMGQSFTPSLSAVSFVDLRFFYSDGLNHSGSFLSVNLRSGSITGPILGSSGTVFVPSTFFGVTNFLFASPLAVTPGLTYFLQCQIQSGGVVSSYIPDG